MPTTAAGRAGLAALRAQPAGALVVLDYDGTLAPIVEDPELAVPEAGALAALAAMRVGTIAVVTGRSATAAVRLGGLDAVPGLIVMGQYGAERWADGHLRSPAVPAGLDRLRRDLAPVIEAESAKIEVKGLSLSIHTRHTVDPGGALDRLAGPVRELASRAGFQCHPGRYVLEVRPPGHDKGRAVLKLADPLPSAVLVAGDDVGDLDAFAAVRELRRRGVAGLAVCADSAEAPPALREEADLVVEGPTGIVGLLRSLAD